MKGNNIILIGMMGAGKSTVGKYLQKMLPNFSLVDIDSKIEEDEGISISEIFERYTEKGFRRIETLTIEDVCKNSNLIISTGGGAFESEENRNILLNSGKVFYLFADSQTLYDRIKTEGHRPLLQCKNPFKIFTEILDNRDKNYRKADYIIDTSSLNPELTAKEILRRVNETVNLS